MTTQSMILDCQELTYDLRDQIHALETLDELLSSFNGREQIDSGGVARYSCDCKHCEQAS